MANFQPVQLAYNTFAPDSEGDSALSPILFLHGLTAYKGYWGDIPQLFANATKRKVYALDARNHGDSDWSDDFTFDINVEDVINFMDVNGISKAVLVGHSMGGLTAVKSALKYPDRIEKIVVEDMFVRKIPKQILDPILLCMSNIRQALEILPDDLDEVGAQKFTLEYFLSNLPPEMAKMMPKENAAEVMLKFFRLKRDSNGRFTSKTNIKVIEKALLDSDSLSSDPSGVYEGPALFIYGQLSPFLVGADAEHIKQFFPNAEFEGVEGASHDVHDDKPQEYRDALLKFIS